MIRVNKGFQVCQEIPDSKETRGAKDCQGSWVHGGSQGLWAKLETKDPLGFLGPLDPRGSPEILAPLGTTAQKAQRVSLELEACRDPVGSWGRREMRDPWGHPGPLAWRVSPAERGFLGGPARMA